MNVHMQDLIQTIQIRGVHRKTMPPRWEYPLHVHPLFELIHCLSGSAVQQVRGKEYQLTAGDWIWLRSGVRHGTRNQADLPLTYMSIHFDIDDRELRKRLQSQELERLADHESLLAERRSIGEQLLRLQSLFASEGLSTEAAMDRNEPIVLSTEDKLYFNAIMLLIVRDVLKLIPRLEGERLTQTSSVQHAERPSLRDEQPTLTLAELEFVHQLASKLERHSGDRSLSITGLIAQLGYSRSRGSRLFTRVFGYPPRQYVSECILRQAKELLVQTDCSVTSIADRLGFDSLSHFSRQFRRWTGVSPQHYRPNHYR